MNRSRFELLGVTHFSPEEFQCKCKGRFCKGAGDIPTHRGLWNWSIEDALDSALLLGLEELRYKAGRVPLRIVSGIRCRGYNEEVKGVKSSQHLLGRAADILTRSPERQATLIRVAKTIPVFYQGGIGRYDRFIHLDVRGQHGQRPARWDARRWTR